VPDGTVVLVVDVVPAGVVVLVRVVLAVGWVPSTLQAVSTTSASMDIKAAIFFISIL
jgi:hypothetical protein